MPRTTLRRGLLPALATVTIGGVTLGSALVGALPAGASTATNPPTTPSTQQSTQQSSQPTARTTAEPTSGPTSGPASSTAPTEVTATTALPGTATAGPTEAATTRPTEAATTGPTTGPTTEQPTTGQPPADESGADTPATAAAVVGTACTGTEGVTVLVDFSGVGGDVEIACAPGDPISGREALTLAGFTPQDSSPGLVCTIDGLPDDCDFTTNGGRFWSYWFATDAGTWDFHTSGADGTDPAPGDVEGWYFGTGDEPTVAPPTGAAPAPGPVPPGPADPQALEQAAAWLAGSLTDGNHVVQAGNVRLDVSTDAGLGLLAAGGQDDALRRLLGYLGASAADYAHGQAFTEFGERADARYAGAVAKLGLLAELSGGNAADVGGLDLLADLDGLAQPSGRWSDVSAFGDNSNVFTQAFGVLLLSAADGVEPPAAAIDYLVGQQCPDGGFPVALDGPTCTSDVDATGLTLQALTATEQDAAAAEAVSFLLGVRAGDGSFSSGTPGAAGANVNTTGYAAMGLASAGEDVATSAAWLAGAANDDGGLPVVVPGASDAFATSQALPALAGTWFLATARDVGAPVAPGDPAPAPGSEPSTPAEPSPSPTTTAPPAGTGGDGGALPRTGSELLPLVGAGLLLLALGGTALATTRRRRAS